MIRNSINFGRIIAILTFPILLMGLVVTVYAEPVIGLTSGSWSHKGLITLEGNGFGLKSPAAPYIWDACDDDSATNLDTHWPGQRYPAPCPNNNPDDDPYLMDYRSSFHGFSDMPHNRITKFISAATTSCGGNFQAPGPSPRHNSVITTNTDFNSNIMFAIYYHRLSNTWSDSDGCCGGPNYKDIGANGPPGGYLDGYGSDAYIGTCVAPEAPSQGNQMCFRAPDHGCKQPDSYYYPSYKDRWIHLEFLWTDTGSEQYASWGDGVAGGVSSSYRTINNDCPNGAPLSISIGGYTRHNKVNATGNYRYWSAIYLDKTFSRVMLGNNSNWNNCTIREPQIPSAWGNGSITCSVNLGALPNSGTAYLFVFDANNNHNTVGYAITIDGGGGGGGEPSSPAGLKILENCTNGDDDDGDGLIDCVDPDCNSDPSCN